VGVLLALSRGGVWGWTSPRTLVAAAVGVVAAVAFVLRERSVTDPMIDLALFGLRSVRTANLAAGASSAALFGTLIMLPFYLTAVEGFSPPQLAVAITPIALSFVVVSPLAGRAMSLGIVRSHVLAACALLVAVAGALSMAALAGRASYWAVLPGMVMIGTGLAASTSAITTTAISEAAPARMGVASSLPNIARYTGAGLGVAALGAVLHAAVPPRLERIAEPVAGTDRGLVAGGFRESMVMAACLLLVAVVAAARMPGQVSLRRPGPR
jgi:DHA2 family methylenomycin A resistance protein-like MFS transporter